MSSIPISGNTESSSTSHDITKDNTDAFTDNALHLQRCRGDLPIVERLPSRNISFQSAEILTLEELSQSLLLATSNEALSRERNVNYDDIKCIFQEKRLEYVRVTGVVLDIVIMESKNDNSNTRKSFLLLGDALFVPNATTSKRTGLSKSTSIGLSTPRQKRDTSAGLQTSHAPDTGSKISDINNSSCTKAVSTFSMGKTLSGKKRKLVTVKPKTHNSLLNKQSQSTRIHQQRVVPSKAKLNHDNEYSTIYCQQAVKRRKQNECLIRKCRQGMHMVLVDVTHMACIDECKLEDLVMVIGLIAFETIRLDDLDGNVDDEFLQVARLINDHRHVGSSPCAIPVKTEAGGPKQRVFGYVQSRIVKVVNGLDMNLFREALVLRRERLFDFEKHGQNNNV
jgi:hypothetical protein